MCIEHLACAAVLLWICLQPCANGVDFRITVITITADSRRLKFLAIKMIYSEVDEFVFILIHCHSKRCCQCRMGSQRALQDESDLNAFLAARHRPLITFFNTKSVRARTFGTTSAHCELNCALKGTSRLHYNSHGRMLMILWELRMRSVTTPIQNV